MLTQCEIYDIDNNEYHGAILLKDGSAICGCCGSILPADELNETWKIVHKYDTWVSLSEEIIGSN